MNLIFLSWLTQSKASELVTKKPKNLRNCD